MSEDVDRIRFTAEDKLQYEVEKLTQEVRVLKHPFSQPASWIAAIALILSLASNIWQFYTSKNEKVLMETQVEQAELRKEKLSKENSELEQKRDFLQQQGAELEVQATSIKATIESLKQKAISPQAVEELNQAREKIDKIETDTKQTTKSLNGQVTDTQQMTMTVSTPRGNLQLAQDKEREGFNHLIGGDYDKAQAAFEESEAAYNRYNSVYEIAKLLTENKSKMKDPETKKAVFNKIAKAYSYKVPRDLIKQVEAIGNQ